MVEDQLTNGANMSIAIVGAILIGAFLGSLADWLFAGIVFHDRYQRYPEVWRDGGSEFGRIVASQGFALLTSAALTLLAVKLHETDLNGFAKLAAVIWLIAPVPMLATNYLFLKIDGLVTLSHMTGWFVKLLLISVTGAILIG